MYKSRISQCAQNCCNGSTSSRSKNVLAAPCLGADTTATHWSAIPNIARGMTKKRRKHHELEHDTQTLIPHQSQTPSMQSRQALNRSMLIEWESALTPAFSHKHNAQI